MSSDGTLAKRPVDLTLIRIFFYPILTHYMRCWFHSLVMCMTLLIAHDSLAQASDSPDSAETSDADAPPIVTVAELRQWPMDRIRAHEVIRLRGVITYAGPEEFRMFLQDETGGIYVPPPRNGEPFPEAGTLVEYTGRTGMGKFAVHLEPLNPGYPTARSTVKWVELGRAPLPAPRPLESRNIGAASILFHRVQAVGVVRKVERKVQFNIHSRLAVKITTFAGPITLAIPLRKVPKDFPPANWVGGVLRFRGVATVQTNDKSELSGIDVMIPGIEELELIQPGASDFWQLPIRSVKSLRLFSPEQGPRVRLHGTVTLHEPGRGLYMEDASGGIWVETPQTQNFPLGSVIDAVGFPPLDVPHPVLEDAVCVERGRGEAPTPAEITPEQALQGTWHGRLVRVKGLVSERHVKAGRASLWLRSGSGSFDARFPENKAVRAENLPARDTQIEVTGICLNAATTGPTGELISSTPKTFEMLMRSEKDITILQLPTWWTLERTLLVLAWVAAGLLVALIAVAWLMRETRRQTLIIRETRAREAVHEERQRLARELHDTLEQRLAGLTFTLDTAHDALPTAILADTTREALGAAREQVRQTASEARRSIWDLRAVALESGDLSRALHEMVANYPQPPSIEVAIHGDARRLPSALENNLLRIATECVTNAVKHARASHVAVGLAFAPTAVTLTIRDDGVGFDTSQPSPDGHFGLVGMHERAAQCHAELKVTSAPGAGTTVWVWAQNGALTL